MGRSTWPRRRIPVERAGARRSWRNDAAPWAAVAGGDGRHRRSRALEPLRPCRRRAVRSAAQRQGPPGHALFLRSYGWASLRDEHVIIAGNRLRQLGVIVGVFKPTDDDPELGVPIRRRAGRWPRAPSPRHWRRWTRVGPYVKIISLDKKDLQALPTFKAADGAFLAPNDTICLGVDAKY